MNRPAVYTATGIVLKRRNWGETDKIVTLYTREYGKLRLMAKGVRKISSRRGGYLEPFRLIKVSVHGSRQTDIISEVTSAADVIAEVSANSIGYSYLFCELVDRLTPESESQEEIFFLLKNAIRSISRSTSPEEFDSLVDSFTNTLLEILGFLERGNRLAHDALVGYVEQIIEKRLTSPKIIQKMVP
jgi:DNA repair protein RecO (recombination protein O)